MDHYDVSFLKNLPRLEHGASVHTIFIRIKVGLSHIQAEAQIYAG